MGSSIFPLPGPAMDGDFYLLDVARLEAERALKHAKVHGRFPSEVSPDARRLLEQVPEGALPLRLHP